MPRVQHNRIFGIVLAVVSKAGGSPSLSLDIKICLALQAGMWQVQLSLGLLYFSLT